MRSFFFFTASTSVLVLAIGGCGGDSGATPSDQDTGVVVDSTSDSNVADSGRDSVAETSGDSTADSTPSDGTADATDDTTDTAIPGDSSGKTCTATGGECDASEYCDVAGCGATGTCKARPTAPSAEFAPTCGCDGVTYWNADQAAASGVSVSGASTGECSGPTTKTCGGLLGKACASGQSCVDDLSSFGTCGVADVGGRCWIIPSSGSCPGGTSSYRDCTTSTCTSYCNAVKSGHSFRSDSSC